MFTINSQSCFGLLKAKSSVLQLMEQTLIYQQKW